MRTPLFTVCLVALCGSLVACTGPLATRDPWFALPHLRIADFARSHAVAIEYGFAELSLHAVLCGPYPARDASVLACPDIPQRPASGALAAAVEAHASRSAVPSP